MSRCMGILRNVPCIFRARYNGYCGFHRRILRECAITDCIYPSRSESMYCEFHDIHFMSWGNNYKVSAPVIKKIILLETDELCSICFDNFTVDEIYELKCKHYFHINCLDKWLQHKHTCPLDRSLIR